MMEGFLEGNGAGTLVLIWCPLVFCGGSVTWTHTSTLVYVGPPRGLLIEGVTAHHNCLHLLSHHVQQNYLQL